MWCPLLVAVPADHAAAVVGQQPSARERRWSDAGEDDGEEAEGDAGLRAPHPLQGDAFARAGGFGVTDVPAAADEFHLSSILNDEEDEL